MAQERHPGRAALPEVMGAQIKGVLGRFGIPFTKSARPVRTPQRKCSLAPPGSRRGQHRAICLCPAHQETR